MRVVVALGGNALLRRGEPMDLPTQRHNVRHAAEAVSDLARDHQVVVTHGNGPQVGLLALQAAASVEVPPYPLDVLGAESEGMIGYLLEQELRRALPDREVATLLTQVEVDPEDPAFAKPAKPIGPVYSGDRAQQLAQAQGWTFARDASGGFRRVVPSPEPGRILELRSIRLLVEAQVLVICAGGGGIPTSASGCGIEAVIDKDLASARLATNLEADALLLLTDQTAVFLDWPDPAERPVREATSDEMRSHGFEAGSMGPKVEAACRFADATNRRAAIGALRDARLILEGKAGTSISARRLR